MFTYDFTDKLPATVPGVDRKHVIKFNNSWLLIGKIDSVYTYLVVYRALVSKKQGAGYDEFADPAPTHPGHPGTPFGDGWRWSRYFDGVGVAKIQIDYSKIGSSFDPIQVADDQIIEKLHGHEDPRIFECEGKTYLHTHKYFKASSPRSHIIPYSETPASENEELCVVVTELEIEKEKYQPGKMCFYAVKVTRFEEKNYGFFTDQGCLNAVYGLASFSDGFAILKSDPGLLEKTAVFDDISAQLVRPYGNQKVAAPLNSFVSIEKHLKTCSTGYGLGALFSSSGPLLNKGKNHWLGVGHVKVKYEDFKKPEAGKDDQKLNSFLSDFLQDRSKFVKVDAGKKLENPLKESRGKSILLSDWIYFSFLYEIVKNGDSYDLGRFSDAFIVTDPANPKMLQFAENLAPIHNGYILSFGENDFRAVMITMTTDELEKLMTHNPADFKPQDYDFKIIPPSRGNDSSRL